MKFNVDCIVDERRPGQEREFLVRWEGYQASWEAWRLPDWQGQPGDPVETWEPLTGVQQTEAFLAWENPPPALQ